MNIGEDPIAVDLAGAFIEPILSQNQAGKVIGITSKGIFLLFGRQVLFLTNETYHNPFMLHIPDRVDFPQQVQLSQEVRLEDRMLWVGEKEYDLRTIARVVPEPIPMHDPSENPRKSAAQIVSLFQALNFRKHQDSLLFIVDALLTDKEFPDSSQQNLWQSVRHLRRGISSRDFDACNIGLQHLMGNGKGLTPSGDDFISGFLLILNSINPTSSGEGEFLNQLDEQVVALARIKTSWISANLIEAATQRLADERVGRAARLLLGSCRSDAVTIAGGLESFGNSSGIDAFTGMAAALLP